MSFVVRSVCLIFFITFGMNECAHRTQGSVELLRTAGMFTSFFAASFFMGICLEKLAHCLCYSLQKDLDQRAFPKATAWIQQELVLSGIDPELIILKSVGPFSWATLTNKDGSSYLFVPANDAQEIENMLTYHPDSVLLNRYRFVINHEAVHIRNKHTIERQAIFFEKNIGYSTMMASYCALFVPALVSSRRSRGFGKAEIKLIMGIIGMVGGMYCALVRGGDFMQGQEQEADDLIRDESAVLEGGIKYFQEVRQYVGDDGRVDIRLLDTHPRLTHRIDVLKKRIAQLVQSSTAYFW